MATKRWSRKAKQQLFLDAIAAAVEFYQLQHIQLELSFEDNSRERAGCYYEAEYRTAQVSVDLKRVRIFELVEFACHELAHIPTWHVAEVLEEWAGEDARLQEKARRVYESITTTMGHIALPHVLRMLEAAGKLPPEAKEIPNIIVAPRRRKAAVVELADAPGLEPGEEESS